MNDIVLVLGGTKSGKTSWAQRRALDIEKKTGLGVSYIATAEPLDDEMAERIERHKEDRPSRWTTWERPIEIHSVLKEAGENRSVILLDCLTLLMSNIMFLDPSEPVKEVVKKKIFKEISLFLDEAEALENTTFIIISNQVENGLVSEHKIGRMFQDIAGMAHQLIAERATEVIIMNAGIGTRIK